MRVNILIILLLLLPACCIGAEDERVTVAQVIAAEAAGEGYEGMYAVGCVISNRAKLWHKTPYQVVTQPHQFYGYMAGNRDKLYRQVKPMADKIATELIEGRIIDVTGGALYFRRYDEPVFKWCKVRTVRIGNHVFYK